MLNVMEAKVWLVGDERAVIFNGDERFFAYYRLDTFSMTFTVYDLDRVGKTFANTVAKAREYPLTTLHPKFIAELSRVINQFDEDI